MENLTRRQFIACLLIAEAIKKAIEDKANNDISILGVSAKLSIIE